MQKTKGLLVLMGLFISLAQLINSQSPSFQTYMNPVIPGDHPDATLTRIGDDYYTTGSSFNPTPYIYHSTDLVHWEIIAQPVSSEWTLYGNAPRGGCWGGHLVYYNGEYWHFFGKDANMYFVKADDPRGPWSMPVAIICPASVPGLGMDNSIFIDDDNSWYLLVKNGQVNNWIVELGSDGQPAGDILDLTWINPPPYLYSWAEGPVMWKDHGYYYYCFAHDVTGGQYIYRSTTLTDEQSSWEDLGDFFTEPVAGATNIIFPAPNHASPAVLLDDATSWVISHGWHKANNNEWSGQGGRQGLLSQMRYDSDEKPMADFPLNVPMEAPNLPSSGIPWMVPKSDFFESSSLNPGWSFLGYTLSSTYSLTERPGWLRLSPRDNGTNTVIKNDAEHNYSLITRIDFSPEIIGDGAGFWIFTGWENVFAKLYSTINMVGHKVLCFNFGAYNYEIENTIGNDVWFKLHRINHLLTGYYSKNGIDWTQIGESINVSSMDIAQVDWNGWIGNRQGLFVQGSKAADFDLYIYRDAYSPILAECPANQFGTSQSIINSSVHPLDSIHNNDWALYAGVEFGSDNYSRVPDSFKVIASSATSGGVIEVWLDSIDTGDKIADCNISNTGGWDTYQTFSADISSLVSGRHDVYLKFTGAPASKLFNLQYLYFTAYAIPEFVSAKAEDDDTLLLKLNIPVRTPTLPCGLEITINGTVNDSITQISLYPGDSTTLILTLEDPISNTDSITISYISGTVSSPLGIELTPFTNQFVDNLLPGSAPRIIWAGIENNGDSLIVKLNKKMISPSAYTNRFSIHVDGSTDISVSAANLVSGDSTSLLLTPSRTIYYEDLISLQYTGTEMISTDGGILPLYPAFLIENTSLGYPLQITATNMQKTGKDKYNRIILKFDKPLLSAPSQAAYFTITVNSVPVSITSCIMSYDSIYFIINPYPFYGDEIRISYSGGDLESWYHGILENFTDYTVPNIIPEPVSVPAVDMYNNDILVYPNPAKTNLTITSEFAFNSVRIYSTDGKIVKEKSFDVSMQTTELTFVLQKGIYIIELRNNQFSRFSRFIVD